MSTGFKYLPDTFRIQLPHNSLQYKLLYTPLSPNHLHGTSFMLPALRVLQATVLPVKVVFPLQKVQRKQFFKKLFKKISYCVAFLPCIVEESFVFKYVL